MGSAEGFEEFVSIVESGSVTAAAQALGLPRPTLSRRLARLEERLGARLLHRTTRRMTITEQGESLYAKARLVVAAAREAEAEVRRSDGIPRGLLRVSVPTELPQGVFTQWVVEFLATCPEVEVELVASAEHVDLVADGFDVALRAGPVDDQSLIQRTLAKNARIAVASPSYLASRGTPTVLGDLAGHNCIVGYRAGLSPERHWPLRDGGTVAVSGTLKTNQMGLRLQAAKQHVGIAMVVDRLVVHELDSGELHQVLPGIVGRDERASLVYPDRRFVDPKVKAFVDFLLARVKTPGLLP